MSSTGPPAFYARGRGTGGWRDWVTLLHPPYTAWHLSYVAIGAALVAHLVLWRLGVSLLAFFLAVGVGAHALDELRGAPLRTGIPPWQLVAAAGSGVAVAIGLGFALGGLAMLPFIVVGGVVVFGYNLELFGGVLHNDATFALGWGSFPVLTGAFAQHLSMSLAAGVAAAAAFGLSWAQRALSTPARELRRRVESVTGELRWPDGRVRTLQAADLVRPLERALRAMSYAVVAFAVALVCARLG